MVRFVAFVLMLVLFAAGCGADSPTEEGAKQIPPPLPPSFTDVDDPELAALLDEVYNLRAVIDRANGGVSRNAVFVLIGRAEDLDDEEGAQLLKRDGPALIASAIEEFQVVADELPSVDVRTEAGLGLRPIYEETLAAQLDALKRYGDHLSDTDEPWTETVAFIDANNAEVERFGARFERWYSSLPESWKAEIERRFR